MRKIQGRISVILLVVAAGCGSSASSTAPTTTSAATATTAAAAPVTTSAATAAVAPTTTVTPTTAATLAPTTTVTPTTTAPLAPTTTVAPTTTAPLAPTLAPGQHTVFIVGLGPASKVPGTNIVVDPIEILDGDAAIAEAVKRGQAAPGPDGKPFVPNDYFTVNDDKSTVTLRVAPDASVMLNVDGGGPKPASLDDAVKLGKTGNIPVSLPFRITVQGTGAEARIVKIDHIFTP